jgi:hypothetical protein
LYLENQRQYPVESEDMAAGRYIKESAEEHLARLNEIF